MASLLEPNTELQIEHGYDLVRAWTREKWRDSCAGRRNADGHRLHAYGVGGGGEAGAGGCRAEGDGRGSRATPTAVIAVDGGRDGRILPPPPPPTAAPVNTIWWAVAETPVVGVAPKSLDAPPILIGVVDAITRDDVGAYVPAPPPEEPFRSGEDPNVRHSGVMDVGDVRQPLGALLGVQPPASVPTGDGNGEV